MPLQMGRRIWPAGRQKAPCAAKASVGGSLCRWQTSFLQKGSARCFSAARSGCIFIPGSALKSWGNMRVLNTRRVGSFLLGHEIRVAAPSSCFASACISLAAAPTTAPCIPPFVTCGDIFPRRGGKSLLTGGGHCCCRPFHRPPYCLRQQGPTPADGPRRNYQRAFCGLYFIIQIIN